MPADVRFKADLVEVVLLHPPRGSSGLRISTCSEFVYVSDPRRVKIWHVEIEYPQDFVDLWTTDNVKGSVDTSGHTVRMCAVLLG